MTARLTAERDAALARIAELEAQLAALTPPPTCIHLTADMAARCPTCNPGCKDATLTPPPDAELDALVAELDALSSPEAETLPDGERLTRFCRVSARIITTLRAIKGG